MLRNLTLAALAVGFSATIHALPTIFLSSNGSSWTPVATDNMGGDTNAAPGQVTFIGSFGSFNLNVHTGTTYPAVGSLVHPVMDLTFNSKSAKAGDLYIGFSADGFGPTSGSPIASIGGTASGSSSVWYATYGGNSDTLLDLSLLKTSQGPFMSAFSGWMTGGPISNPGPYSLSQVVHVVATAGGQLATGDALLSVPDASTTLMLMGAGLTGLAMFGRVRRRFV